MKELQTWELYPLLREIMAAWRAEGHSKVEKLIVQFLLVVDGAKKFGVTTLASNLLSLVRQGMQKSEAVGE